MQITTKGLIIREVKVGEADRILTILTEELGVITAVAKSSMRLKSKLFNATGLFCYSDLTLYSGKSMYTVDNADVKEIFFGLRNSVEAVALAMYFAELCIILSPQGLEAGRHLSLMLNCLYFLCDGKKSMRQIKAVYELRTMAEAGFMPDLVGCEECVGFESNAYYFDIKKGKVLCAQCCKKHGVNPNITASTFAAMRHIVFSEPKKLFNFELNDENLDNLSKYTGMYTISKIDRELRTLDFLRGVLT